MSLTPFSLKDSPAFIERQFPVGRLSAEAYKERKANLGQTLTALGSYWKGRKPLILCRAVTLGCLLPATNDDVADLAVFLALMGMDDAAFGRRWEGSAAEFARALPAFAELVTEETASRRGRRWRVDLDEAALQERIARALATLPYAERVRLVSRPEEIDEAQLLSAVWPSVNQHLKSSARSLSELIEQLGVARFGHRPKVADTFCGGGSIPFEAARIGCDVFASDLSPVACMLTWGAFNIVGAPPERRAKLSRAQEIVAERVDSEITKMGFEEDADGNRAKAYLYCLETICPRTGWMVPMAASWVISKTRNIVARLVPDHVTRRYDIQVVTGVSAREMEEAELGTVRAGRLIHPMNADKSGVEIKVIRGDKPGGGNALRPWTVDDFMPREGDIWQERLYCVQWIDSATRAYARPLTFFSSVTEEDIAREKQVQAHVRENLARWQKEGRVPDMPILLGEETSRLLRERGWTHWHHLFCARQLAMFADYFLDSTPEGAILNLKTLDWNAKIANWMVNWEKTNNVFYNQALNTFYNYGTRCFLNNEAGRSRDLASVRMPNTIVTICAADAREVSKTADIYITDPPYADAVNYHEITEFFIAWLRKNPPAPFDTWTWDSRRDLAIKGQGADFRRAMVDAYAAMTKHMPDDGLQVVMFTHQDAGVWSDLAGILWGAGLRVTAAWNIVTETDSPLRAGNYVQGTVCLVLRKRLGGANARRMEIESEIEDEVKAQLAGLTTLDDGWTTATGGETLYTDGDLTLAAYAAALRVVTGYATIDRRDVGADVFREVKREEKTPLRQLIDYAAGIANRELVPRDFPRGAWRDLEPASRFYVRMLDMEARGHPKVADFQNFAKSFALSDYTALMASTVANAASLAGAASLKGKPLRDEPLARQPLFQVLFAVWKTMEKGDPKVGVTHLRTELGPDYWPRRSSLVDLADYLAAKTQRTRPTESVAAADLAEALRVDRV